MINLSAFSPRLLNALLLAAILGGSTVAAAEPTPSPAPAATTDPCGATHTDVLATIDRPTVGFSGCAVKPKEILAEFGYANQASSDAANALNYPQGFIRFGVAPNFEFDLIAPTGHSDSGAGLKYELYHDSVSTAAVDVLYTAPNGAPAYSAGSATETLNFDAGTSFARSWNGGITLGYQIGNVSAILPSAVLAKQCSSSTQAYVETYGATRIRRDGGWRIAYDAGVQHLLNERIEVDVEGGHIVTDRDRSQFLGFGFGLRF